jgi:hypothetical protein
MFVSCTAPPWVLVSCLRVSSRLRLASPLFSSIAHSSLSSIFKSTLPIGPMTHSHSCFECFSPKTFPVVNVDDIDSELQRLRHTLHSHILGTICIHSLWSLGRARSPQYITYRSDRHGRKIKDVVKIVSVQHWFLDFWRFLPFLHVSPPCTRHFHVEGQLLLCPG